MPEKFPHKPPAPSVNSAIGSAFNDLQLVEDILAKLDLPAPFRKHLRNRYGLEPDAAPPADKSK
jgi:hypothetical protein